MARLRITRLAIVVVVAGSVGVVFAAPAGAHGIGGTQPSNYETTLTRVTPSVPGVTVEVVDLGNNLRLTNSTDRDVVVLGYDGEPYLRIGPRGVFENRKSPATYLNRTRIPTKGAPAVADSDAAPVWHEVSSGNVAVWHDHRAHWMGTTAPPAVQRDPDRRHLIDRWTVPLRVGTRAVAAHGVLEWVPPPSPWPAVALAVGLAALVIGLSRTRWWRRVLVVTLAVMVVCATLHTVGHWGATSAGFGTRFTESLYGIVGIALGLLALAWAWRRGVEAAVPFVLVAAIFLLIATGLGDISTIGHSQVPSSLPASVARLAVTITIGLGVGLAVAAGLRLRVLVPPRPEAPAVTS
ncbi:MAG TPA: hypothetical protein VFZ17_00255 [Acidimicrobiia bacterium]|nr:hypothetical protein [Acidimicrobiia bacterium]